MRRLLVTVLALTLVGATLAFATPDAAERAGKLRGTLAAQTHAPAGVPSNDNYGAVIYNHFGNPAAGQALIETWTRQTYSDLLLPNTNQGFGRAVRVLNVQRIAIRVVLHTRGGTNDDNATGPTCNNGTQAANPRIFNCTSPTISTGGTVENPNFCESWTTVHYAIRWTDGTLSFGKTLTAPADLFNDNCYFLGGP